MGGAENRCACSTQPLSCASCLVNPKAGLLTDSWNARPAAFPLPHATVACFAGELADHSGATVRELHPLPSWLGFEHLGTNSEIVATVRKKRQEFSPLTQIRGRVQGSGDTEPVWRLKLNGHKRHKKHKKNHLIGKSRNQEARFVTFVFIVVNTESCSTPPSELRPRKIDPGLPVC